MPYRYTAALAGEIENRWQDYWNANETFHVPNPGEAGFDASKPKKFIMDMFPYPSGVGLHVGHPLGYIATDIYSRFLRTVGYNVLHPMGFDAFGLPAEQHAVETGQHPRVTTENNIETMRRQMRRLGLGHDPKRSLATTDVEFYRWTQWIFLQIYQAWYDSESRRARPIAELIAQFESGERQPEDAKANPDDLAWNELSEGARSAIVDGHRLAYVDEVPVNWCPGLGTVLANEEVTAEGRSERGNFPVYKRPLKQWIMRITAYCERLIEDLLALDWPEPIKLMQRNWIGRSEGAEVDFLLLTEGAESENAWFQERARDGWTSGAPAEDAVVRVYTTRPDTLYGASYMVLSPEHPLVDALVADAWPGGSPVEWRGRFPGRPSVDAFPKEMVEAYRSYASGRSDVERQVETKEKTGVFTGAYAINPVNRQRIPVFIADYVLMGYGTGAIMAVPAHDTRDFEFAMQFALPIPPVVLPTNDWLEEHVAPALKAAGLDAVSVDMLEKAYRHAGDAADEYGRHYERNEAFAGQGTSFSSEVIEGLPTAQATKRITEWLTERGLGQGAVNYRLRDWLFSRQRYWGEPFPVFYRSDGSVEPMAASELPLELPEIDDYRPEVSDDPESLPQPPLGRAKEWVTIERDGETLTRELSTMPNWAGSCWYYLRYLDPRNNDVIVAPESERYWMTTPKGDGSGEQAIGGVDLYVGGAEHAVLHLLYARFWHKVLYDLGKVSTPEPFQRLYNQGYIQAAAFTDDRGMYVPAAKIEEKDGEFYYESKPVNRVFGKMGKSLKNAVTPDEMCSEYGADTLRLYEMYMGPLDVSKPWNTRDIVGVHRFLQRLWRNLIDESTGELLVTKSEADAQLRKLLHRTIDGVRIDMEALGFNTAIAKLIELNNALVPLDAIPEEVAVPLVKMLAPLAPHIGEELWKRMGNTSTIAYESYPTHDPSLLVENEIEIPVMINGKLRSRVNISADADRNVQEEAARADEKIAQQLADKEIKKVIVVPGKMVNFVV